MAERYVLAIDQGTTNTKALLVDSCGGVAARASHPLSVSYPQPAWVEQDALEIWRSVEAAIDECLAQTPLSPLAVGITNQRESVVVWERDTGQPVGPCVVWQCHRSASFCQRLREQGLEPAIRAHTGLTVDPMFSASKARWLLDSIPDGMSRARQGELCIGTIDSWLLWNLTGGAVHACDATNASRTQLMSLQKLDWDAEMLGLFGIPRAALPAIRPSSHIYGQTRPLGRLPGGVPIASMIGDSHAALFGHAGFQPGSIKATYGTGSSLMTPMARPVISERGLSTTVAWARREPTYALEGNIYATGAAVQWLAQILGLSGMAEEVERLASSVHDSGGVYLVPAFVGLGAPYWRESARGLISGLTRGSTAADLARAAIESIAYQVRDVFDVMEAESGAPLQTLLADGGASRNDTLMQFQADIIGRPVLRSTSVETSVLGAAYLAGLAVGLWRTDGEIAALVAGHDRFEPLMSQLRRAELYAGWQAAVARAVLQP